MKGIAAAPCKRAFPATAFGWEGGPPALALSNISSNVVTVTPYPSRSLASRQGKVHRNFRIHFNRFAIQQIGLVLPLPHGVERTLYQHGMPADQLQVFDGPIFADLRSQNNCSLNARLPCQRRVARLYLLDKQTRYHA